MPNEEVWLQRSTRRGTDFVVVFNKRLGNLKKEIDCLVEYDYLVSGGDICQAVEVVKDIMMAKTNRRRKYINPVKEYYIN